MNRNSRWRDVVATEDDEGITFMQLCRRHEYAVPGLETMHHVPNGGGRSKAEAGRFKAMGVKSGVSDYFWPEPLHGFHGLYIELKSLRIDARVSDAQKWWCYKMCQKGYYATVARGSAAAWDIVTAYIAGSVSMETNPWSFQRR